MDVPRGNRLRKRRTNTTHNGTAVEKMPYGTIGARSEYMAGPAPRTSKEQMRETPTVTTIPIGMRRLRNNVISKCAETCVQFVTKGLRDIRNTDGRQYGLKREELTSRMERAGSNSGQALAAQLSPAALGLYPSPPYGRRGK